MPVNGNEPRLTQILARLDTRAVTFRASVGGSQSDWQTVVGSPNGAVRGSIGDGRIQTDVARLWLKTSGDNTDTGWEALEPGSAEDPFYANAADFGLPRDGITDSYTALQAFLDRIGDDAASGGKGWGYIPEGDYVYSQTPVQRANTFVFGAGLNTTLRPDPGVDGWSFEPVGGLGQPALNRAEFAYVQILGTQAAPTGIGIDLNQRLMVHLHDLQVWDFAIGILISDGAVFSAYHKIGPQLEVNRCPVGIRALANANGNQIDDVRIFWSFTLAEGGVGLDLADCQGMEIPGIAIESADTCVRVRNSNDASGALTQISGGTWYLEPGANPDTSSPGLTTDVVIVNRFDGIEVFDVRNIIGSGLLGDIDLPPEGFVRTNVPSRFFYGARFDGAAVSKRGSYVYNGFMQYYGLPSVLPNWGVSGTAPTLAESATAYRGPRSLLATANATNSGVGANLVVTDPGNEWVMCGVAYKVGPGNTGFFISASAGAGSRQLVDPIPGTDLTTDPWRIRYLQVPVDPASPSGGVTCVIDSVSGTGQALIGGIWAVPGRYASPLAQYGERIETLPAPIQIFQATVTGNTTWGPIDLATLPSTLAAPLDDFSTAPVGAVGAVVRLRIETTDGATVGLMSNQHWHYIDVPASGAIVAADINRVMAIYSTVPNEGMFMIRDMTLSGGYIAGDGFTTILTVHIVAWIMP